MEGNGSKQNFGSFIKNERKLNSNVPVFEIYTAPQSLTLSRCKIGGIINEIDLLHNSRGLTHKPHFKRRFMS